MCPLNGFTAYYLNLTRVLTSPVLILTESLAGFKPRQLHVGGGGEGVRPRGPNNPAPQEVEPRIDFS